MADAGESSLLNVSPLSGSIVTVLDNKFDRDPNEQRCAGAETQERRR